MAPESLPPGLAALEGVQDVFHVADGYFEAQENDGQPVRTTTTFIPEIQEDGGIGIRVKRRPQDLSDIDEQVAGIDYPRFVQQSDLLAQYLLKKLESVSVDSSVHATIVKLTSRLTELSQIASRIKMSAELGIDGNQAMHFLWKMEALFKDDNDESLPNALVLKKFLEL